MKLNELKFMIILAFLSCYFSHEVSSQAIFEEARIKPIDIVILQKSLQSLAIKNVETGIYPQADGTDIVIDAASNLVLNIPVVQHSSYRKYSGYYYEPYDVTYPPGYYGDQIVSAETANLNGDDYPDAVVMTVTTSQINEFSDESDAINPERVPRVHFLINKGNGQFENGDYLIKGNIDRVYSYKHVMVGDLNNDGLDDILTPSDGGGDALTRDDGILILMSQPDGSYVDATSSIEFPRTFTDRGEFTEEVMRLTTSVIIPVDVNNDGWKDIFTTGSTSPEAGYGFPNVLINNQGKSFTPWNKYQGSNLGLFTLNEFIQFRGGQKADFDLDGSEDVVLMCYRQCFNSDTDYADFKSGIVFLNEGADFSRQKALPLPPGLFGDNSKYDNLDVGDVNGDGYPDIIFTMGKRDPYYANRAIQILINDNGRGFIDETESRITDIRNEYNGHAEGSTYLIDYDNDGDLDIFDFQDNVRDGKAIHDSIGDDDQISYPYWNSGVAIFLNDGIGNFEYLDEDILHLRELSSALPENELWRLDILRTPYKVLPLDFGGEYGIGFILGMFAWHNSSNPAIPDVQTSSIATARKIDQRDKFSR